MAIELLQVLQVLLVQGIIGEYRDNCKNLYFTNVYQLATADKNIVQKKYFLGYK